jgi:hypothetical protein
MTLALHSSESNEHYTPLDVIEAARQVMGEIDLDPASSQSVNENRVKAARYFTQKDDGLTKIWRGRVWLNPPGKVMNGRSRAAVWWEKLVDDYLDGYVEQAIFLGFSVEIFALSQDARLWVGGVPFCIPRTRLRYAHEVTPGVFKDGESPTHADVIAYLPPRTMYHSPADSPIGLFERTFSPWGKVRV